MAKINLSGIPIDAPVVLGPLTYEVAGQGAFTFYLCEPDFPQALALEEQVGALTKKLLRQPEGATPGGSGAAPRYPCEFYIPVSPALCRSVAMVGALLCDANGKPLRGEDAYAEDDLFRMSKQLPAIFTDLTVKAAELCQQAEDKLGNASGGLTAPSSATPSTTEPSATPTASE